MKALYATSPTTRGSSRSISIAAAKPAAGS